MTTTQPSHRASLLAGLRTGGVRSASVPHTAGPQSSFVVPQPHTINYPPSFTEEDEMDNLAHMMSNGAHISQRFDNHPRTANCDMTAAQLSHQQQQQWNGIQAHVNPMSNDVHPMSAYGNQQQELQLQMMQMELMRLQALSQLQQYAQYRQDNQHHAPQSAFQQNVGTGYPGLNVANNAQVPVPMTAAIGGKFGRRASYNPIYEDEVNGYGNRQLNPAVLNQQVNNAILKSDAIVQNIAPSKSDSAISWRNNSNDPVLTRDNMANQRRSPLPRRSRPEPLELRAVSVALDSDLTYSRETSESSNDSSSTKSDGEQVSSTPTTPVSGNSNGSLSAAREEASKKLFQGLGLGRPAIHVTAPSESAIPTSIIIGSSNGVTATGTNRAVSQPIRQPRGPPASAEELSTKNFANRIRKKAIGGLEALLEARERRDGVPVLQESY